MRSNVRRGWLNEIELRVCRGVSEGDGVLCRAGYGFFVLRRVIRR